MTEVAARGPAPHTAASTATNGDYADDYSVPLQAELVFKQGILQNPLIQKNLPADYAKYAAPISFTGSALPAIPINWRFAESVSALKALEGTYVNALLDKKYGVSPQKVLVNTDHAQLYFMSAIVCTVDPGRRDAVSISPFQRGGDEEARNRFESWFPNTDIHGGKGFIPHFRAATNIYKTKDERFFHLHGSLNPVHTIKCVGLPQQREVQELSEAVKPYMEAVGQIDSADLQKRVSDEYGQAGTICWSVDEFRNSEHGKANAHIELFEIEKHAGSSQKPGWWPDSAQTGPSRPLAGLKVVDLTRIIAAPAVSRGLAEHGASVMRVTATHLPDMHLLHPDLNWGKWNCSIDLRTEEGRKTLKDLIMDADVVLSGYRPGVMEKWGFGPEDILEMVKNRDRGIIVARENCYGWHGPWSYRTGWQQISDANVGVSLEFGRAMGNDEPVTPVFPNSDYCTGIAGFCGITQAILQRGETGGSYLVGLALNYYSQWLANSVGTYPAPVWDSLWAHHGRPVFRHWQSMDVTIPAFLKMLHADGSRGKAIFDPAFFEDRVAENLKDEDGKSVKVRTNKPVLQFPEGKVKPGFNVGTRGNGADAARWPEDLMTQVVR